VTSRPRRDLNRQEGLKDEFQDALLVVLGHLNFGIRIYVM